MKEIYKKPHINVVEFKVEMGSEFSASSVSGDNDETYYDTEEVTSSGNSFGGNLFRDPQE